MHGWPFYEVRIYRENQRVYLMDYIKLTNACGLYICLMDTENVAYLERKSMDEKWIIQNSREKMLFQD